MTLRRDALLDAARMLDAVDAVAFEHELHPVITAGSTDARPNSPDTISDQTRFSVDSRHSDNAVLATVGKHMQRNRSTLHRLSFACPM